VGRFGRGECYVTKKGNVEKGSIEHSEGTAEEDDVPQPKHNPSGRGGWTQTTPTESEGENRVGGSEGRMKGTNLAV